MWAVAVLPTLVAPLAAAAGGAFAFPSMLFFGEIPPRLREPSTRSRSVAALRHLAAAAAGGETESQRAAEQSLYTHTLQHSYDLRTSIVNHSLRG